MKSHLIIPFAVLLLLISCSKEEVDPNDYRGKGEVKDNTIYLREGTTLLGETEKASLMEVSEETITVEEGTMSGKNAGEVLVNLAKGLDGDTVSFFRRIVRVEKLQGKTVYHTANASWKDAYEKWAIDSRSDKFTIKSRSLFWDENVEINATEFAKISGDYMFTPRFQANVKFDDYYFTSFFDSTAIANADDLNDIDPAFHLHFSKLRISISGNATFGASVTLAKDIEFGLPAQIFIIPETGFSLYFQPKIGYSVDLNGQITTPTLDAVFGDYDLDLTYNVWDSEPTFTVISHPPALEERDNPGWQIEGSGSVEFQGGVDLFVGLTGAPSTFKTGLFLFNYLEPGITHQGDFSNLQPEYDLNFEIGGGIKFFFSFNIIEDWVEYSWSSEDYKFALWQYTYRDFPCPAFSFVNLNFNRNTGLFDLRVGSNERPLGHFNLSVNEVTLTQLGDPDFNYNTLYALNTALPTDPINKLVIADKSLVGCYLEDNYVDPGAFGNCAATVLDAQGNDYCTVQIGQLTWMAENLRRTDFGAAYPSETVGEDRLYGRLYTFDEILNGANGVSSRIQGLCPNGWHLPSIAEWNDLINGLGGQSNAGKNIKYPSESLWPTASLPATGTFNAVSAGEHYTWRGSGRDAFGNRGKLTRFWTTQTDSRTGAILIVEVTGKDRISEQNVTNADPYFYHSVKEAGYSCRCVQDY